jgi:cytochrome b subunit of formate dehydrogenase
MTELSSTPPTTASVRYVKRFDRVDRVTHALLIVSFLGLAATGMPLEFADTAWAGWLARLWGGVEVAGTIHRICATLMIALFTVHVARVLRKWIVNRDVGVLWGPRSMVPQPRDLGEMYQHFRWFVCLGPRPRFGRYTYWEKFDYWAVFWGMLIIGGSGLLLWFPLFFSRFLPGEVFNVALLVHGEEALLAVAFIFTIHFFNGHFRPEKFPMDLVMFTGSVTEAELKHERPAEWERLVASGQLSAVEAPPPNPTVVAYGRLFGGLALVAGVGLFLLIFIGWLS